jgi:Raf kinase inhibitor-like YbhB/YbcL family protein
MMEALMRRTAFVLLLVICCLFCFGVLGKEVTKVINLTVTSPVVKNNEKIPTKYTCDGKDISPPLTVRGVPKEAKSLALIVDDPDAPVGVWVHWVVWNIDPKTTKIPEGSVPAGALQGKNDFQRLTYGGPCPPSGTHRYFFKVYALDMMLNLAANSTKTDLEKAMKGHITAEGQLVGLYKRGWF